MDIYRSNRNCDCMRCRLRGSMASVILMVVGFLFLLDEGFRFRELNFDRTWPLILITVGVMLMLQRTASMEGHMQPYLTPPSVPPVQPYANTSSGATPTSSTSTSGLSTEVRHE